MNTKRILMKLGLAVVERATRQDNIPFCRGDLRKSIGAYGVEDEGADMVSVGSNLEYARALHDGRPALTIRPKRGKILAFWKDGDCRHPKPLPRGKAFSDAVAAGEIIVARQVHQKARAGDPFLARAAEAVSRSDLEFLAEDLTAEALDILRRSLRVE